ncbi:hypothetical protein [Streptomyces sp. NPDC048590]|uniref:hypothetical protein n=1 Tax=Streptomyces sp. NPDC048590 TaxID=3365574 RepID=UPI00371460C3
MVVETGRSTGEIAERAAGCVAVAPDAPSVMEFPEGSEWLVRETLYESVTICRRDAVTETGEWRPVWQAMEALSEQHGDDNVRLVVWFDD